MRELTTYRVLAGTALATGLSLLAGCATTARPQQYRTYLLPPAVAKAAIPEPAIADPPPQVAMLYAGEAPLLPASSISIPRPSDTEFLIKRADDHYASGKKALQDGRLEDARVEFNRAIDVLLSATPEGSEPPTEHARLEQHLQDLVDAISSYDAGELGAGETLDQAAADARPLDEILDLTFPIDPSLRNKVRAQIQATASQLPLEETDAVVSYINFFSSPRGKKILESGIRRSGRYKAMIERVLAEEGVPQELIFLAQAESGFLPHAVSNKLCVGMWQFAKFRGEEYGLQVTSMTDARMDPEQATHAAARHLHDLYNHLGDWYLAMAAYDCGPLCIDRAVERTGYADFWALRRLNVLPQETANYVPAILAMVIIAKNAQDYGLDDIQFDPPLEYDSVELQSATHLGLVAEALDLPLSEIREMNPAVLHQVAPVGYKLHVPKGTVESLEQALAVIPASHRDSWRIHRVEEGDTLASLAKRFNTSADSLRAANHDELPDAGLFAAIPASYPSDHPASKTGKSSAKHAAKGSTHTVAASTHSSGTKTVASSTHRKASKKPSTVAQKTGAKTAAHRTPGA